ncbi:MAG: peptidoglycan editing factor PgeF [Rickettsiaceae bacterium]
MYVVMELEFIKNKVYYKFFDKTYTSSSGIYSIHRYDDAAKLAEIQQNINNIKRDFATKDLIILKQVHGNYVLCADTADPTQQLEADAVVATKKNVALSILTADCVPVLFASSNGDVIGAAHCGWRSAKADIIHNVKNMMKNKGAKNIKAIIGPAIGQESYEVDANYYQAFVNGSAAYMDLFKPSSKNNHFMFNLVGFVARKLAYDDIELVHNVCEDTYSLPEKYPSYRRCVHQGLPYSQNILSTIIIK